jgi:alanine racemase
VRPSRSLIVPSPSFEAVPESRGPPVKSQRQLDAAPTRGWVEIDLDAVCHNVRTLAALASPARLCAVVKADAYGHGAAPVAKAAVASGASTLAVESVDEAIALRLAGVNAQILVLSEPDRNGACEIVEFDLTPVVSTREGVSTIAEMVRASETRRQRPVHLGIDTGLHGIGCRAGDAVGLSIEIAQRPELFLEGVCTHFAVADQSAHPFTRQQLDQFTRVLEEIRANGVEVGLVHVANTVASLTMPHAHFDMIRCGSGIYGIEPASAFAGAPTLRPALAVRAGVTRVQRFPAGTCISYGLRYELPRDAHVATLPIGYASGIPRALATSGQVLLHGQRCPIAGNIMMDHLFVDAGEIDVRVGDEAVLLGRQKGQEITAIEWANRLGTLADEVVCNLGTGLPRQYSSRSTLIPGESEH